MACDRLFEQQKKSWHKNGWNNFHQLQPQRLWDISFKENAQLIQLIDLILGLSNQILFGSSKSKNKVKVANDFYPLFKRLWNRPYNSNSSYNYFRSQQVSIFPKTTINSQKDFEGLINDTHQFHHEMEISDPQSLLEQTSLEEWF